MKASIRSAEEKHGKVLDNLLLDYALVETFGKDMIKDRKLSPDSVAKLAFQVRLDCLLCRKVLCQLIMR